MNFCIIIGETEWIMYCYWIDQSTFFFCMTVLFLTAAKCAEVCHNQIKLKNELVNSVSKNNELTLTFEDCECSFGWNSITDPIFRNTFVWCIVTTGSYRFNSKYWLSIYLVHRISTLRSRYLFAIFTPDYGWNRITSGCTEKARNTTYSYWLINRPLRNFRRI